MHGRQNALKLAGVTFLGSYLTRRLALAVPTVFGVVLAVFLLIRLVPGDVVTQLVGLEATISPKRVDELRRLFGLDRPLPVQFAEYLGGVAQGDLGKSLRTGLPVGRELLRRFPVTIELAALGLLVALCVGVPVGVLAAVRRGRAADYLATGFVMVGLSIPSFWLAILLILFFALRLGVLPPTAYIAPRENLIGNLLHMILPALSVGFVLAAAITRIVRSSLLEVLNRHYVRTARAKGLAEGRVILHHAMRNALIPVVTLAGLQIPALLAGAVITEQVFEWPGMGRLTIEAINQRDYPVLMGITIVTAVLVTVGNLLADVTYSLVDPRIRYE